MIYVNSTLPIEELSKLYIQKQKESKKQTTDNWMEEKRKQDKYEYHRQWAKQNKTHLQKYREKNREKIREQYNNYMNKKK